MPRTRHELERADKIEEILDAAVERLRAGGYDALSVAGIARDLGIAQNAIYWYFPSKDLLFVAALERLMRAIVTGKPRHNQSLERKVLWFVDQLGEVEHVRASMYERARSSDVVAGFVVELHQSWRRMLSNVLAHQLAEPELTTTTQALIATIQGAFLQEQDPAARRRLIAFALKRLVPQAGPTTRRSASP
jgi:AcrR family transcriptional regulator